ncbi:hypothetical protein LHP98_00315 [Rhodobacter sp. Har01]|uniref:hypothetical protein n=1 Tax=Rhodobacter sp. Har01 TaxID=2883999 RepID=UPI001D081F72|nr:hypothetical protein [Rhodobacter sp. Har01]MCB6176572.1 hypothetical protein [Rhodobacter sp. Har01]
MDQDLLEPTPVEAAARTFRRRVFYIPGYDPIHPRRYRELYRKEGTEQARLGGYSIDQTAKTTKGPFGWHVTGQIEGGRVEADVEVLVWSDIVRDSMSNSILATYTQLVRTAWAYIGSGALIGLIKLRKGPTIAALYPITFLTLQLLAAVLAGGAVAALVAAFTHWTLGLIAFAAVVTAGLRWFRSVDHKVYAYYLMHDYAFSALSGGANPPALETRMAEFRAAIRAALEQDFDEVLVVGHSSGAHVGISILADLIRGGLPLHRPALAFLTLGQVVPMVSFLPGAHRLRADLRYLSAREEITWVDVTAPGDGCAFALCDPVAVSGVAPPNQRWPLIVSAAFTQTLSPQRWKALRWRFFRLHFQYLCAFDGLRGRPGEFDYFRITAGPLTLAERFRGRAASASRITKAVNPHTGLAP